MKGQHKTSTLSFLFLSHTLSLHTRLHSQFDMGGAAATLGAARILAETQPAGVEVHFIVAACENMVAGKGLRPGDILTAASGKTIEVGIGQKVGGARGGRGKKGGRLCALKAPIKPALGEAGGLEWSLAPPSA